jgi:hypothetical protein
MPPVTAARPPEPEDIFSSARLGKGGPTYPSSPETTASIAESPARGLGRKLIRLLFLALGAAVIVTAGYFGYQYFLAVTAPATPPEINANVPLNENVNTPVNQPVGNTNANENANANVNVQAPLINENINTPPPGVFFPPQDDPNSTLDTDRDGLTDYQETHTYNTNLTNADTDNDGLSDRDEVITWKTDPLKADTDGDGYTDGSEVENGYNPSGSGKLLPPVLQ